MIDVAAAPTERCRKPVGVSCRPCILPPGHEGDCKPYERPEVKSIGNARDLLAGADGSITDADMTDPVLHPNQSS